MWAFVIHTICDCSSKIRLSQVNILETVIIQTLVALYIPNLLRLPTLFWKQHFVSALSQYPHMQNISNLSHHRIFPGLSSQPAVIAAGLLLSLFTLNKSGHYASSYCLRFIEFQTFCLGPLPLPWLCLTLLPLPSHQSKDQTLFQFLQINNPLPKNFKLGHHYTFTSALTPSPTSTSASFPSGNKWKASLFSNHVAHHFTFPLQVIFTTKKD